VVDAEGLVTLAFFVTRLLVWFVSSAITAGCVGELLLVLFSAGTARSGEAGVSAKDGAGLTGAG
jgi:hypothetical protein